MSAPAPALPHMRKRRRRDKEIPLEEGELLNLLTRWQPLHAMAATLPTYQPGEPGRPPDLPPAAILIFGMLYWGERRSERRVDRMMRNPAFWEVFRRNLGDRYPGYRGLQVGAIPMRRSDYRRYRARYGIRDDVFASLHGEFQNMWTDFATKMGMFDPSKGTLSMPAVENILYGDGTVLKSLWDAAPGDMQLDPTTGEIKQKRHDPDARFYETGDKKKVYGTPFGFISARLPNSDGEGLVLDVFSIADASGDKDGEQDGEAARALEAIERLQRLLPAAQGTVWDMTMRGKHNQWHYDRGLILITKVAKAPGGKPKNRSLGRVAARKHGRLVGNPVVRAVAGRPHVEVVAAGQQVLVPLVRGQIKRCAASRRNGFRYYAVYHIPDEPPVDRHLRGAHLLIRLNENPGEPPGRAEALRAIPEGDVAWKEIFGLRESSETLNSWYKDYIRNKRAPCATRARQRFSLLCGAMFHNFKALVTFCRRRNLPIPGICPTPP